MDYANKAFKEGGRNPVSGWRSDRGRIYAKYGRPDQVFREQQKGRAPPYEVWSYAKGKGDYYIFADRSGFGAFYPDPFQRSEGDRRSRAGPTFSAVRPWPIYRQFLGIDLTSGNRF